MEFLSPPIYPVVLKLALSHNRHRLRRPHLKLFLERLLNLHRPELFERELILPPSGEPPQIQVPEIEKLLLRNYKTAKLFRQRTKFVGDF